MTQWIFPMAGSGTRLKELGEFKPFIPIGSRTILEWSLLGISEQIKSSDTLYFVVTKQQESDFHVASTTETIINSVFKGNYPQIRICTIESQLAGPACTVREIASGMNKNECTIIQNPDQYVRFAPPHDLAATDAAMVLYCGLSPKASYAKIHDLLVVDTAEKEVISATASAGIYIFGSGELLQWCLQQGINPSNQFLGEHYIAPLMPLVLQRGGKIYPIPTTIKMDLGDLPSIQEFTTIIGHFAQ
jgi:NDP-sugar pyrophosphorylase family protein